MILVAILVLGVLVFVHELGHFLFAKYYNVGVIEFALGFGPKVCSFLKGDTQYSIRAIPLGGYVRMVGESPDQENQETENLSEIEKKLISDKSRWFSKQRIFARSMIVFAGPLFNILFAWLLASAAIYSYGISDPLTTPVIGDVLPDFPAEKAGLMKGDKILSINGVEIKEWKEIKKEVTKGEGKPIDVLIERTKDNVPSKLTLSMNPKETSGELDYVIGSGEGKKSYMIGLVPAEERVFLSLPNSVFYGGLHTAGAIWINVKSIVGLVKGIISPQNLGGPVMIFQEAAKTARKGLEALINFMIFLSVSLAVLNLLPIPVLDGGHLTFFLFEALRGKPAALRVQEYAMRAGMTLLLLLMVYALRNDIMRVIG